MGVINDNIERGPLEHHQHAKGELKYEFSDLFGKAGISWLKKLKLSSLGQADA